MTIENGMISAISSTRPAAAAAAVETETETELLVREIVDLPGYALIPGILKFTTIGISWCHDTHALRS